MYHITCGLGETKTPQGFPEFLFKQIIEGDFLYYSIDFRN
jgi:hypothetical protein